jgi:hypothetical protein
MPAHPRPLPARPAYPISQGQDERAMGQKEGGAARNDSGGPPRGLDTMG